MYAVECFASFFTSNMNLRTLVRVWDLIIMRIPDVMPLTLLAVIFNVREELAGLSIEDLIPKLKESLKVAEPETLVPVIFHPPTPSFLDQCRIS